MQTIPNQVSPAQGGQTLNTAAAPAGQQTAPAQQQAEGGQQPQFVTKAELDAFKQDLMKTTQSAVDKGQARIEKKLTELKGAGITATPEQAKALVDAEDLLHGGQQQGVSQGQPQAQAQPGGNQQPDPNVSKAMSWMKEDGISVPNDITAEAYQMMASADVRITENDPEMKSIGGKNAHEFLNSVSKAIADKQARLGKVSVAATPNLSSGGGAKVSNAGKTSTQILEEYYQSKG